jgi:hypothetical protein
VSVFLVNRLRWCGKCRIGKTADRHRHRLRLPGRVPINCRAACAAEVEGDGKAVVGHAAVSARHTGDLGCGGVEESRNAERATGSPLAFQAMAKRNLRWLGVAAYAQLAAGAACSSRHCRLAGCQSVPQDLRLFRRDCHSGPQVPAVAKRTLLFPRRAARTRFFLLRPAPPLRPATGRLRRTIAFRRSHLSPLMPRVHPCRK